MQIHEITLLNENALGAFASGFAQSAGISTPPGAEGDSGSVSGYGTGRQVAAAAAAEPLIAAMAKKEMDSWNDTVVGLVSKNNVQSPAQLDSSTKMSLKRDLWNRLHQVFMRGTVGNNYIQSLPTSVNKQSQPTAKALVNQLNLATQAIMNFNKLPPNATEQLKQWTNLARTAYEAMSLVQFHPSQNATKVQPTPKIKPNPDKSFNIGTQKLNPGDPVTAKIIQKIQAEQSATPGQEPEIKRDPDATYTLGRQKLNPRDPVDAKLIQIIQAAEQAEMGVTA